MIRLSTHKKAFTSIPVPESTKEVLGKIEEVVLKQIGELSPYVYNKANFSTAINSIHDDLKEIRPIIEFISANDKSGGSLAMKESNISDSYHYYEKLKKMIKSEYNEGESADATQAEEPQEAAASLKTSMFKKALDETKGLADKIEILMYLGRLGDLKELRNKINNTYKMGELLVKAIGGEGRATVSAVEELQEECRSALVAIDTVEGSMESLADIPDKLERIVDLLRDSILARIKDIKGT